MLTLSAATANRVIFPNRSPFLENLYFPVSMSFVLNPNLDYRSYRVRGQAQKLSVVLYYKKNNSSQYYFVQCTMGAHSFKCVEHIAHP